MKTLLALIPLLASAPAHASVVTYSCNVHLQQIYPREIPVGSEKTFTLTFDDKVEEDGSYGLSESASESVGVGHDITIKTTLYLQNATYKTSRTLERKLKERVSVAVADHEERATTATVDLEQPELDIQLNENLRAVSECLRKN